MNLKATGGLIILAIAVGIVVLVNPFKEPEEDKPDDPWFYQVSMDDIIAIDIDHFNDAVAFRKDELGMWEFTDPEGIPPNTTRWGGITLLLSGPQTRRDLTATRIVIEDPAEYGLDDPATVVSIGLIGDRHLEFRLGDTTTNGDQHYGQIPGFPYLFLIASAWGDVLSRLAVEPPLPMWFEKRSPENIEEFNIFYGDPTIQPTPSVGFNNEDEGWTVRDYGSDLGRQPVDSKVWDDVLPLIAEPPRISVAVSLVDDRDYTPWGITEDSTTIEIRFAGLTDSGTRFINGILLRIGDKTPDGVHYYGRSVSSFVREPILLLDSQWIDTLLALGDDIPYAEEATSEVVSPTG